MTNELTCDIFDSAIEYFVNNINFNYKLNKMIKENKSKEDSINASNAISLKHTRRAVVGMRKIADLIVHSAIKHEDDKRELYTIDVKFDEDNVHNNTMCSEEELEQALQFYKDICFQIFKFNNVDQPVYKFNTNATLQLCLLYDLKANYEMIINEIIGNTSPKDRPSGNINKEEVLQITDGLFKNAEDVYEDKESLDIINIIERRVNRTKEEFFNMIEDNQYRFNRSDVNNLANKFGYISQYCKESAKFFNELYIAVEKGQNDFIDNIISNDYKVVKSNLDKYSKHVDAITTYTQYGLKTLSEIKNNSK